MRPSFMLWSSRWRIRMLVALVALVAGAVAVPLVAQITTLRTPLPLAQKTGIKIVYEARTNEWHSDMGAHLYHLGRLLEVYEAAGIPRKDVAISVVFHGEAAYWTLTDLVFNEQMLVDTGNPNRPVIQELARAGVSFELCQLTMADQEWGESDILPEVKLTPSAYGRIVDLQLQGYAYIKY